jgi:hypothetical protein
MSKVLALSRVFVRSSITSAEAMSGCREARRCSVVIVGNRLIRVYVYWDSSPEKPCSRRVESYKTCHRETAKRNYGIHCID